MRNFKRFYGALSAYQEEYGNCHVPRQYITNDGIKLGKMLSNARFGRYSLSDSERKQLEEIGVDWCIKKVTSFDEVYRLLMRYVEEHGDCNVPSQYVTQEGIRLGGIVAKIRCGTRKVSDSERKKLDSIGFLWHANNRLPFEELYQLLMRYVEEHGDCNVPQKYVTPEGICLGRIAATIRCGHRKVSESQKKKLNSIGFIWRASKILSFEQVYQLLVRYVEEHGDCNVPSKYVTAEGIYLGKLVVSIRSGNRKVSDREKKKLDSIGFRWRINNRLSFQEVYQLLMKYVKEHGNCNVPSQYVTSNGVHLGDIVAKIRSGNRRVDDNEKKMLSSIGFIWHEDDQLLFEEVYPLLIRYVEKHGNCNVPRKYVTSEGVHLGRIVANIRCGNMRVSNDERIKLDSIGFIWYAKRKIPFEEVYQLLVRYKEKYGNCNVQAHYVTQEGIRLGVIVAGIRSGNRKVSKMEREKLDAIGFLWHIRNK